MRYLLIVTTVAAVVTAGTVVANAEWAVSGAAQAKIHNLKMPAGTKPSVEDQSNSAVVSWSAQEIVPGVKMDRYTVTAHSQDTPPRAAIVREVEASGGVSETITFAAAEVAGGKWRWAVIPHYAKWVGAESGLSGALTFPDAAVSKVAGTPPAKTVVPTIPPTAAPVPTPTAKTTKKPAAEPVTTTPAPPSPEKAEDTAPPPASSPAEAKPATTAAEPSASGSADEGIPE
uniref:hypothetical protein n=1 Tax=Paractinoplanes polyasparticus TaxID=2856853 RepID=UPI001C84D34E|nr:hypothetical protein [Actinoplanes polyasparticus]